MHATALKKIMFRLFNKIRLMDPIRNFAYTWVWERMNALPRSTQVLDVGSRNSPFPAFCAWQGFAVTAIDIDERFFSWQNRIRRRWRCCLGIRQTDIRDVPDEERYGAVIAVFSLQHAGRSDSNCYRKAASLLVPGGVLLLVNEYSPRGTIILQGRDDGDLTRYGPAELESRIEQPLLSAGMSAEEKLFAHAQFEKGVVCFPADHHTGSVCLMSWKKGK